MLVKDKLLDAGYDDAVYFTDFGYDDAFIGVDTEGRAVYDYSKMVDYLIEKEGFSDIEAIEWVDYNTIRSLPYIDSSTKGKAPIIVYPTDWLGV